MWREDASNADQHYRRAALRHDVLPRLEVLVPGAAGRIAQAAAFVRAEQRLAAPAWQRLFNAALAETPQGGLVRAAALEGLPEAVRTGVLFEAARRFLPHGATADLAARLDRLLRGQVGRHIGQQSQVVYRTREGLRFSPALSEIEGDYHPSYLDVGGLVHVSDGWLWLGELGHTYVTVRNPNVAFFDADVLALPLTCLLYTSPSPRDS